MKKPSLLAATRFLPLLALTTFAAGAIFLSSAHAQQAPASNAAKTPPPASPQAKPESKEAPPRALTTDKDKISYTIGMNIGKALKRDDVDVDLGIMLQAIKDQLSGAKPLLTDQEAQETIAAFQTDLRKKQELKMQQLAETNKKEGEAFLAANKTKEGVVALPSGLQYKILQEGAGPKPAPTDMVTVNYRGTLLDGTEFDSSYKRGQPVTFGVNQIIKGWTEALELMPVGSKWQLFIPSELAYGPRSAGPTIGPNATLIFEVELLSIQPKPAPAPPAAPAASPAPTTPKPTTAPAPTTTPTATPAPKPAPAPAPSPTPTPTP